MSQFILYLERVQENRNYFYESKTKKEYIEMGAKQRPNGDWYMNGLKLEDPKFETSEDRYEAGGIRPALLKPARDAKQWNGRLKLTPDEKETFKKVFIQTPIAALISLGLILAQTIPPRMQEIAFNNIENDALEEIYSGKNVTMDKTEAINIIRSTIEKAKSGKLNDNDIKELYEINPDASEKLEEVKKSYPTLIERIKGFFSK